MRVKTSKDIGLVIRDRRRKLRLSQQALADRVGVSRQWIVAVERGKPRVEASLLLRTMHTLGLDLDIDVRDARPAPPDAIVPDIDIDAVIDRARGRKR